MAIKSKTKEHILERNHFLVVGVPSHFLKLGIWKCIEELILERNHFIVISVPSDFLPLEILRFNKEHIVVKTHFPVISVPSSFLFLATWRCTDVLVRNYFPVISVQNHFLHLVIWKCIKEFILTTIGEICWDTNATATIPITTIINTAGFFCYNFGI